MTTDMNYHLRIIGEGIVVGILLILYVYVASWVLSQFSKLSGVSMKPSFTDACKSVCETWNDKYVMEKTLFLAGFLFHVSFEYTGFNRRYCDYSLKLNP